MRALHPSRSAYFTQIRVFHKNTYLGGKKPLRERRGELRTYISYRFGSQIGDEKLLLHLPGGELRSGSCPHSGLGWGPHKSTKKYKKHATVFVTISKVSNPEFSWTSRCFSGMLFLNILLVGFIGVTLCAPHKLGRGGISPRQA